MCCTNIVAWIVTVTPILITLLISGFVAWITHQQLKTNQEKLRLDLYNRRFDIYAKTLNFYHALLEYDASKKASTFSSLHNEFIKSQREAQFLFDRNSQIFQILEELHSKSFKIIGFKEDGKKTISCPEMLSKMAAEMTEAFSFFDLSIKKLEVAMARYLDFHKVLA